MLTLYYTPNTCALATHIALEEAGAEYVARRIDFASGQQQSPDYLKINPRGRVPALVTPHGCLAETPALLIYIAQSFPAAKLAPLDDPFALAEMQAFASYLASTVHVAHAHRPRGARWADEAASLADMKRKAPQNMRACFDLIAREFFRGPWTMGETYSVVDPYLFTVASWLPMHDIDVSEFPRVADHFQRMKARPAVIRALAAEASP